MNFISVILKELERSSPGSVDTARQVISLLGDVSAKSVLFVGDDISTPRHIKEKFGGAQVRAAFTEPFRAEQGSAAGLDCCAVQLDDLPGENGGYDLFWYNGIVEVDSCAQRLEQLREKLHKGGTLVYRAVSWLTEPSPDTKVFCQRRFGQILPLDKVLVLAKEQGYKVRDFYIAPKSDWHGGFYDPLIAMAERYAGVHKEDSTVSLGMSELSKEYGVFEMHCEEYSCVYYILKG